MATAYSAYAVYTYSTPSPSGMAGRLIDSGAAPITTAITVSPNMRTNLNGDPKVEGFTDAASNLRIAVTDYVNGQREPVYIHDAANGAQVAGPVTWPEDNLYTLIKFGNYLYAIDYDNARVIEIDASTYTATGVIYTHPAPSGFQAVGQELIVANNMLYGLFACPNSGWTAYAPSQIVRFNVVPGSRITAAVVNANITENAFAIATHGSGRATTLYIASIGGMQQAGTYNANSTLQSLSAGFTATTTPTTLMSPSSSLPYEFRDISFDTSGTAYVLAGAYDASWNMNGRLFSTTNFSSMRTIDTIAAVPGYFWSAQWTADNQRIWYAHGNDVWTYDATNISVAPSQKSMSALSGGGAYTDLNDLTYVGPAGSRTTLRGYRSPIQRSRSPLAVALRALTQGRPEATEEEIAQAQASLK